MIVDNIVAVHAVTELQSSTLSSNYSALSKRDTVFPDLFFSNCCVNEIIVNVLINAL